MRVHEYLYPAISQYQELLIQIEQSSPTPQTNQIFQVLRARDIVQEALEKGESPPESLFLKLIELDQLLQKQQSKIARVKEYASWRKSLNPPDSAWWWYFPPNQQQTQLDWLWNGFSLVLLTISVSLIIDGIPRFLSGGLDIASVLAVIIPSLLALLTSGALTPIGREARNYLFQKLDQSRWSFISLSLSFAPLIEGKNALDESQVKTSEDFQKVKYALLKNLGWAQLELKNYSEAKSLLQDAIALNSTKAPAYCLLAQVLEAQKDEALTNWNYCVAYADLGKPDEYLWLSIAREKLKKGS